MQGHSREDCPTKVTLPTAVLNWQAYLYGNKVILSFESISSGNYALDWIRAFNEEHTIKLFLQDELPNLLFVIPFDILADPNAKKTLLQLPMMNALDKFASINDYYSGSDASNPVNFKHLLSAWRFVYMCKGSPGIFNYIRTLLGHIEKYVW